MLNVLGGLQNGYTDPVSVIYPGDGQVGVATNMVSWQFRPFDATVTLNGATLRDANGKDVPFQTLPADGYFNIVAIKATAALTPR